MHELSLALDTIDLVVREAEKAGVSVVHEIHIEVGSLSNIEPDAFEFAVKLSAKDTLLENTNIRLIRTPGKGRCSGCDREFFMSGLFDCCPECNSSPSEITDGKNFMIRSIVVE